MSIVKFRIFKYFFKLKKGNINKPFENIPKSRNRLWIYFYAALSHLAFK